ncbi:hypothetical protein J2Z40_003237 [Cytobacillus eiseniae]|uniref:Uncharacterized protein n=1 Tax=Cytobacillus eiseniae TaxID=762947 RepID=A0ABS4RIC7_9BACI|nr:hypothetical protein [Cytobacillus eiseniae]
MGQKIRIGKRKCPIEKLYGTKDQKKQEEMSHRGVLWDKRSEEARGNVS